MNPPLALPPEIPDTLADVAALMTRIGTGAVLFGPDDRVAFATDRYRDLYRFCGLEARPTFDDVLIRTYAHGDSCGRPAPEDARSKLARLNERRQRFERMSYTRAFPAPLYCYHESHPSGWTLQVRADPKVLGLTDFLSDDDEAGGPSLIVAIAQRELAQQRAALLDSVALALAVLRPDCGVLFSNAAFDGLVSSRDGLELDDLGRLRATSGTVTLPRLVAMAAAGTLRQSAVCVERPRGGDPHAASVSAGCGALAGHAVVLVAPALLDTASLSAVLNRDFGLSPAEASFAALVGAGLAPDEAAQTLGKSLDTGRSQIRAAYRKLTRAGATSQPKLVKWAALLASVTAAAGRGH
ncbi:hypothetical protein MCW82_07210 [Azospirillum doebereinerae]|uniref:helix-turn-helix transcriptional regulator n=1 Tax=Azospirillum doebereinerae TaxID=92933 RepID=UPI001EE5868B|nr:hypothetical protein [Azospirillum doebereinerae]MCG5239556.1 hypothetical protein [Azospirillum doebereinerae]